MKKMTLLLLFVLFLGGSTSAHAQPINWVSLSEAQELAKENNKKVMVFAEADWCSYCKKMHREVFPKATVQDSLSKYFFPVKLDIESNSGTTFNGQEYTEQSLARKFRVSSTPTLIFLNPKGDILGTQPGFLPAKVFDKLLAYVGADLTGKVSFKQYLKDHGVEIGK